MKKGLESLKLAVLHDTENAENCFNENGCDHEFTRMEPETNPGLIAIGITQCCRRVSKCSHKFCDKYKWVIERAKYYAEKTGKPFEEIIKTWEENRTYWYMSYYQECNQPLSGRSKKDEQIVKTKERIDFLKNEVETWDFLSTTLIHEHQQSTKNDLLNKAKSMRVELSECQSRLNLYEISCFD